MKRWPTTIFLVEDWTSIVIIAYIRMSLLLFVQCNISVGLHPAERIDYSHADAYLRNAEYL